MPPISRRDFLALGASTLGAAYLAACSDGGNGGSNGPPATPTATVPGVEERPTATAEALSTWRQLPASGVPILARRDHSLVTDGQVLYVFGGRNPDPLGDLWSYDLATETWTRIDPGGETPPPRFGHNAVWDADAGRMLVFGGQSFATFFNDVWSFDPATGWEQLVAAGPPPAGRYGAAGDLDGDGRLLVTHGFTSGGRFDDSWVFAPGGASWEELAVLGPAPIERCLMRGVWDRRSGHLLMFGGQTNSQPFLGDTWVLGGIQWREIVADPGPAPRAFYALAFDEPDDVAVLVGGNSADGLRNDVWIFDATREQWRELAVEGEAPSPRLGHDAAFLPETGSLLVFGGGVGESDSDELWELHLAL